MELSTLGDLRQRKKKKSGVVSWSAMTSISGKRYSPLSLSPLVGYIFITGFIIIIKLILLYDNMLPRQILLEEERNFPGRFIGQQAELYLKSLTDLGTRVVGSYENEVLAVEFFKKEITSIIEEANRIHKIQLDIQNATDSYTLYSTFRNHYCNIQNIVVKLSSSNSTNSLLLNCHYDTVAESKGASDNGLNCAVLLEVLRVISKSKTPLRNNVIFLFNGAEETPMQGSHAFLAHKWSKEVKALINLDSAGAGGKEVLFQMTGELWLLKAYARSVPHPTAGVQAEELFRYGVIPSDTDFRIFKNFGNYSGFDMAHCTNGYIYHTRFDQIQFIPSGVYQNTGDNILALVKEVANSPELGKKHPKGLITYFDVFGLWVAVYSEHFGIFINMVTVIISVLAMTRTISILPVRPLSFGIAIGGQALGLCLAAAAVFLIAQTLDTLDSTMSWYLRPWLTIPLYCYPIALAMVSMLLLARRQMKKDLPGHDVIRFILAAQLLWTSLLLVGTYFKIRSTYILMMLILFPSIGSLLITFRRGVFSVRCYLIVYMCALIFPTLYTLCQGLRAITTLIPMTSRTGPNINVEFLIGSSTFIISITYLSEIIPILLLFRKLKYFLISLSMCFLLAMVAVTCTPFGFPFDGDIESPALQRLYVLHTERTYYNEKSKLLRNDSGYFIQSLDRKGVDHVMKLMPELKKAKSTYRNCSAEIFCGFPVFSARYVKSTPYSYFIPADPPEFSSPMIFKVVNKTQKGNILRMFISIKGPDHMTVGISPRTNVELVGWSFNEFIPLAFELVRGRKTYLITHTHGLEGQIMFHLDLKIPPKEGSPFINLVVSGHYVNEKNLRTEKYQRFLSAFPLWTHLTPWVTRYQQWRV